MGSGHRMVTVYFAVFGGIDPRRPHRIRPAAALGVGGPRRVVALADHVVAGQ